MFAGVWTALVTFYMTREILPVASAKAAAVLTGVFPSMGKSVGYVIDRAVVIALVDSQHPRCVGHPLHGADRAVRYAPVQEIPAFSPLDFSPQPYSA